MKRDIGRLKREYFDILIIGGGINGCAIARDAALRGAKAGLIEKDDFASGASGKTTKLIHGGIRYLEQFNFKLVYEALAERSILLRTAPHLVRPLEFIIPAYKHDPRPLFKIKAGVFIYDLLAGKDNIRCHRSLKKDELIQLERNISSQNLKGGVIYCDAQMDDIRLSLDNAVSACRAGASGANKVEATGFIKENGKIAGASARDKLTGEGFAIRAKVVVNATGAWSNGLVKMDEPLAPPITRPTKGTHIVYRKLPHSRAILLSAHKDKRVFFVIPWRGLTLIGTTDTDYSGPCDEVYATSGEVEYLLEEARRVFPNEIIDNSGIITTYAALRPLVNIQGRLPWQVSREHLVKISDSGLISVVGGKYTTYRHLAEEVTDTALSKLNGRNFKRCVTAESGPSLPVGEEKMDLRKLIERAVKDEMANTLVDLLVRRLELARTPSLGLDRLEECAHIMAELLGWSAAQEEYEMRLYKEETRKNLRFAAPRGII
ncbi:MAG: glycerol-3-phosphate dehydrogenase/oxidase [Candidatus Omnitrophota bacterium]|nr:glycerol-3-phosphate dehydrogenase/oxidase [Candidatus Omnitrophota bacterium]